jgi:hypothetical protein
MIVDHGKKIPEILNIRETYLEFELEDKLKVGRGSDDMDATVGKRKAYAYVD